jgi:8-oxo-dGTP pyrophosphatase MutT (NUDIX family)
MFVEKVVIYITQGNKLLVFRHTNYPQAGIQVPAGTVGTNEDLIEATIREASEETGLAVGKLEFRSKLGTDVFQFDDVDGSPPVRRHFYHLEFVGIARQRWIHYEEDPSDGTSAPIEFELYWVKIPDEIPELSGRLGVMLNRLHPAR